MKIKINYSIFFILILSVLVSCSGRSEDSSLVEEHKEGGNSLVQDESNQEAPQTFEAVDQQVPNLPKTEASKIKEVEVAKKEIEKKYGTQWDFCTCVTKGDSVNMAMMEEGVSDEDFDQLMARSDFIDNKCKHLLIQPNSTPEEREAHAKKVKDCLRRAGR